MARGARWTGAVTIRRVMSSPPHSRLSSHGLPLELSDHRLGIGQWVHSQGDADLIYNQLQQLRGSMAWPNASIQQFQRRPRYVDYIAYSANRKETLGNGPKGVLNTHAQASASLGHEGGKRTAGNSDDVQEVGKQLSNFYQRWQARSCTNAVIQAHETVTR